MKGFSEGQFHGIQCGGIRERYCRDRGRRTKVHSLGTAYDTAVTLCMIGKFWNMRTKSGGGILRGPLPAVQ